MSTADVLMHLLVLGAFWLETAQGLGAVLMQVLMHLLVLGAF